MPMQEVIDAIRVELAQRPSDDLIISLRLFEQREQAEGPLPEHERLIRSLISGLVEERNPQVSFPLERWVSDDDDDRSYVRVLLDALPDAPC